MVDRPKVFLALPRYGPVDWHVVEGLMHTSKTADVCLMPHSVSLLSLNFNILWCQALNRREELGLTHFAMLHADIGPEAYWLDTLLAEQQRIGADILSAVVPIKDQRGLTSTGVLDPATCKVRRLTMTEVHRLPATFAITDIDTEIPDAILAVNTGLWVCDFTKPWVEDHYFTIVDGIKKDDDGLFRATCVSEDWVFSFRAVQRWGLKLAATRAVKLSHYGGAEYANDVPWGEWLTDKEA